MERAVHRFLEESARRHPDKVALVQGEERASYRELNAKANCLAATLKERGVQSGDRVVVLFGNSLAYVVSYYGILKLGAVAVPLNGDIKGEALLRLLCELRPSAILCPGACEPMLHGMGELPGVLTLFVDGISLSWRSRGPEAIPFADAARDCDLPDPQWTLPSGSLASIIYTSGSTGKPKGVMLSHGNIVANTLSIVDYLELSERDIQMVVLPFFYVMGKSLLNTHVAVGGTVVVNNEFAYPASVVRQMAAEKVTGFSGVPSTYAYLLHRSPLSSFRDRLSSLRYCTQAGGHMAREVKERLLEALPPHTLLYVMYGATEAAARLTYVEPAMLRRKLDSIGRPIPGVAVRVLDDKGHEVPDGACGELVASGDNIMLGYWNDPEGTARVLDEDGYHTGDLGYRDSDGYLYVTGRRDDLLKVGGHRIDPQEIEDTLMATGLLLEVAVVGAEDALLGKKLVAVAVPVGARPSEEALLAGCLARLPRHKIPAEIRFFPTLPKSASGKIDRAGCLVLCGG